MKQTLYKLSLAALALTAGSAFGQTMAYGAPISLEIAKKAVQAAASEMRKHKFEMTIAVVDSGNGIKAPTKVIEDLIVSQHRVNLIAVPGVLSLVVSEDKGRRLLSGNALYGSFVDLLSQIEAA